MMTKTHLQKSNQPSDTKKIIYLVIICTGFYVLSLIRLNNIYFQVIFFAYLLAVFIYILGKNWLSQLNPKKIDKILVLSIIIFSILFSLISIVRHNQYLSHAYDLGLFSQVIWNYSRYGIGDSAIRGFTNIFGDHLSPILVLFAPLYRIWSDPRLLLICQAIIVSLAVWPLYHIAKNKISHIGALFLSLAYLSYCGVGFAVKFDFHEIILFPALFLFSLYFFEKKRYFLYFIFVILMFMVKENIAVYLGFFSIYLFFRSKKIAIITLLLSIGYYILATKYIIPHFSGGNSGYFLFSAFGANEIDALKNIFLHPFHLINVATDNLQKNDTILAIFGSFGFLIFFCPNFILIALPMLAEQVLYDIPTHWAIYYHYSIAIAPILALGTICAMKRIANARYILAQKIKNIEVFLFLSIFVLCSSLVITLVQRAPLVTFFTPSFYRDYPWTLDIDKLIAEIPAYASVGAQDNIVPHISARKYVTGYPLVRDSRMTSPEYYIFSAQGSYYPLTTQCEEMRQIGSIFAKSDYGLFLRFGDAYLFKINYRDDISQKEGLDHLKKTDLTCTIDQ